MEAVQQQLAIKKNRYIDLFTTGSTTITTTTI